MLVFLDCYEEIVGFPGQDVGKKQQIEIDDETAVLLRDKRSGQQSLIQEKQIFFPK